MEKKQDDNMDSFYANNQNHYDTGLIRIGCSEKQARLYAGYFRELREYYYHVILAMVDILKKNNRSIRVLDVGCGLGDDIRALNARNKDIEYVGVEVSQSGIDRCLIDKEDNMTFMYGSLDELSFERQSFDVIINYCVMEHVVDQAALVRECKRLLKNEGAMVIVVPSHLNSWVWSLPRYLRLKLSGNKVKTHSVKYHIMKDAFKNNDLNLIHFDSFGFRPPQKFFCLVNEGVLFFLIEIMKRIGDGLHSSYLFKILYLDLYIVENVSSNRKNTLDVLKKRKNIMPVFIWGGAALPFYIFEWLRYFLGIPLRLIKKILRK